MDIEKLEDKYIKLLLETCLNFKQDKALLINVSLKETIPFALKVKKYAEKLGIYDVHIHVEDMDELHDYLKNTKLEEIKLNPLIDRGIWDSYAKRGAALLFIESDVPGLMSDVDSEKISKMLEIRNATRPYYRENVSKYIFPWCIAAVPNKRWADSVFKNEDNSYEKLYMKIFEMCMIDKENPEKEWKKYIAKNNEKKEILDSLEITDLYYKNKLGTNLHISKKKDVKWLNIDESNDIGGEMIVNMPSYEIFSSPDCTKTEGIVYSSRPLINEGNVIDEFYLKFEKGHIVEAHAKVGDEHLKRLIFDHKNADMLGEMALVPYDSPISNTKIVFNTTLFDENASCHLAIGDSFQTVVDNYQNLSEEKLKEYNLNKSDIHVDFMIGTDDLEIEADTNKGRITIFKNGNFVI